MKFKKNKQDLETQLQDAFENADVRLRNNCGHCKDSFGDYATLKKIRNTKLITMLL